jgi:hypothetical protein
MGTVEQAVREAAFAILRRGEKAAPALIAGFIAWLPTDPCTNVREELCPRANLFCDAAHLDAWRAVWAEPQGEALSLPEVEARGRRWWGIFNEQQGGEQ